MRERIAECINILGSFCGKRDIPLLTREELKNKYGIDQADVMVLFGGSILCGGDVLAEAMEAQAAGKYIIAGGAGHTTETLRLKMNAEFPEIQTKGLPEAKIFEAYLETRYGLHADFLECDSTNCGNNITYLLELLKREHISCDSIILAQDATMQHRMEAGLRKYAPDMRIINYAVYDAKVVLKDSELAFDKEIWGMWDMDRYINLLLGEIVRLADDRGGYGPKGSNFIAHVEISAKVREAFSELEKEYAGMVRKADPQYASSNLR